MSANYVIFALVTFCLFTSSIALQCWLCGQYNDGVGSITPCINYTHMVLKECPTREHTFCIVSIILNKILFIGTFYAKFQINHQILFALLSCAFFLQDRF